MKIILLGDTHFGARADSFAFQEYFEKFFIETLFPYMDKHNITDVIQLGDMFDRRKYINFSTLSRFRKVFLHRFEELGYNLHTFPGNHDIYYRNTAEVNSLRELVEGIKNIKVYYKPTTVDFDGCKIDIIPWITSEDQITTMEFIEQTTSDICIGHFELSGFEILKGIVHRGGMSSSLLSDYHSVYSGHFHHESKQGNIHYIGTPYEITWSDYNDNKGFHVLNTDTLKVEKIRNLQSMFHMIAYSDDEIETLNYKQYAGAIIKVIVEERDDEKFEIFIDRLYSVEPVSIVVIEATAIAEEDIDINLDTEDTLTTILRNIDNIQNDNIDKNKIKLMCQEIYNEAIDLGREQ